MFPTLPEDLSTLDVAALKALRNEITAAFTAKTAPGGLAEGETIAQVREEAASLRGQVTTEIARQEAAAEAAALADEDDEPEVEDAEAEDEPEVEEAEADEAAADEVVDEAPAEVVATAKPVVRTKVGVAAAPAKPAKAQRTDPGVFKATAGVPGKKAGESFADWMELAQALLEYADSVADSAGQRFNVGTAKANFDPSMRMGDLMVDNLRLFEKDEITAAMCAPLPPLYDLACQNSTARPVKSSLPVFQTPTRGGFQVYPSPTLEDITAGTGTGLWTRVDDANGGATKNACATIKCATPASYYIYAVYRCLTVKNLLAMTFPELVEAYLNRLAALHARLAETQLLEAMAVDTTTIVAHTLGYNATTSIATNILNYLALYQEQQRWDVGEMDAWMPRWVLYALKADLMRRKRFDGGTNLVPSDGEIARIFSDAGVTPHFFRDSPSWVTPIPKLQTTGQLGWFTRNLEMLVAPRGKFAVMDRGDLNIGVAGNIMRDNTSLNRNEFTFFFENFEGIIDTTSCPAHILQFNNLCFNGVQIADVVINCEGADQVGAAS